MRASYLIQTVTLSSLLAAGAALADIQADFTIRTQKDGKKAQLQGTLYRKGSVSRYEVSGMAGLEGKGALVSIIDATNHKTTVLMPAQKLAMVSSVDSMKAVNEHNPLADCGTLQAEGCLKKHGLKKTGSETVAGQNCEVWEGTPDKKQLKLWIPETAVPAQEVWPLKMTLSRGETEKFSLETTRFSKGPVDAGLLKVPSDYRVVDPAALMKGLSGGKGMPASGGTCGPEAAQKGGC